MKKEPWIYKGDFTVTEDMIIDGKFIKDKIPNIVTGYFDAYLFIALSIKKIKLISLEGCPSEVGGEFNCSSNKLVSLKGCPSKVGGHFICEGNELTSLEGCPSKVGGDFSCENNELTSLKGCPSEILKDFYCNGNKLISLDYGPSEVLGDFSCTHNKLTSLKGCSSKIGGDFDCYNNELISLDYGPFTVGGYFDCDDNINDLEIEIEFIKSGSYKNEYWPDLLSYMMKNDINIYEISTWPKGFITYNLKKSIKSISKFNL